MDQNPEEYVVIGKIGSPFGIKGWVKIQSFTEWSLDIFEYSPWYIETGGQWQPVKVVESKEHGKGLVAKLVGWDNPEQARLITGKVIAVKREQLPTLKNAEYYWRDLIGLTVINQDGKTLGTVSHLLETGANDVLIVKNDKEHAIPYLPGSVIVSVDMAKREIHVNWEVI